MWALVGNGLIHEQKPTGPSLSENALAWGCLLLPRCHRVIVPCQPGAEGGVGSLSHIPQALSGRQKAGKTASGGVRPRSGLSRQTTPVDFQTHAEARAERLPRFIGKLGLIQLRIQFERSHWSCAEMNEF